MVASSESQRNCKEFGNSKKCDWKLEKLKLRTQEVEIERGMVISCTRKCQYCLCKTCNMLYKEGDHS